jgi:hypothetical protein
MPPDQQVRLQLTSMVIWAGSAKVGQKCPNIGPVVCAVRTKPRSGFRRRYTPRVAKYDRLRDHLRSLPSGQRRLTLGFRRLEELLGEPLPPSAAKYEAWWLGGPAPVGRAQVWRDQVQEQAWQAAGWAVDEVDLLLRIVTFERRTIRG